MMVTIQRIVAMQILAVGLLIASAPAADYYRPGGSQPYRPASSGSRAPTPAGYGNSNRAGYGQSGQTAQTKARPSALSTSATSGAGSTRSPTQPTKAALVPPTENRAAPAPAAPVSAPAPAEAAEAPEVNTPPVEQALRLSPVQKGIEISVPKDDEVSRCKILARKMDGGIGWVIEDPAGLMLRRFADTNGDNKVDLWCYFKDGLEVYRDIDSDFNSKADQYRWFSTAGTRWGVDKNEDGVVDSWQVISAEEVSAEVIAAISYRDETRFSRVLLSPEEIESLGLGKAKAEALDAKVRAVPAKFREVAQGGTIGAKAKWNHFSAAQPGVVPAGTDGSTRDLTVYENAVAIVQNDSAHIQLQIGTLIRVGQAWKVIDAPQPITESQGLANSGFFFQLPQPTRAPIAAGAPSPQSQEILAQLEKLDAAANKATSPAEQAQLHGQRADLLEKMADEATKPEDRAMWLRQLADMIGAAVQSGAFPGGEKRLESLFEKVQTSEKDKQLSGYVRYRQLTAEYGLAVQVKGVDFAKLQAEWLKKLEGFVAEFPRSPDAAEAMLQLGIAEEFAGKEDEAKKWYGQIVSDFADSPPAKKAAGARRRLDCVGRPLSLQGKGVNGEVVELEKYRGQVVVIQYWATWCEPCKADMAILKDLLSKHTRELAVIGVNLDNSEQALSAYLTENRLPWPQIFEPGGQESRPAVELGVLTLPLMILIDQEGKVVNRNIAGTEVEGELKRLIK